jgi:hypothetical protein
LGHKQFLGVSTAAQSLALILSANESFVELARERIRLQDGEPLTSHRELRGFRNKSTDKSRLPSSITTGVDGRAGITDGDPVDVSE